MKALMIGQHLELSMVIPDLLNRAGFEVDVLTSNVQLNYLRRVAHVYVTENIHELVSKARNCLSQPYQLIVITDDLTLKIILDSHLTCSQKTALLPVLSHEHFSHLYSKIGLSHLFKKHHVLTPDFFIAHEFAEITQKIPQLGYPVLIKIDSSGGGEGVFACNHAQDLASLQFKLSCYPVLVQKKIPGMVIDVSGFFQQGRLIHFDYSTFEQVGPNQFGASIVRKYHALSTIDPRIFDELSHIGRILGADGFSNITCIHSTVDNKRYYFEADMRPNAWVAHSRYFTTDIAQRIKDYFATGATLQHNHTDDVASQNYILLPYIPRMSIYAILINRYYCWKYLDKNIMIPLFKTWWAARWQGLLRWHYLAWSKRLLALAISFTITKLND